MDGVSRWSADATSPAPFLPDPRFGRLEMVVGELPNTGRLGAVLAMAEVMEVAAVGDSVGVVSPGGEDGGLSLWPKLVARHALEEARVTAYKLNSCRNRFAKPSPGRRCTLPRTPRRGPLRSTPTTPFRSGVSPLGTPCSREGRGVVWPRCGWRGAAR